MEKLQNFGPNDVQNGTLAQMFRQAGIDDVQSYVNDVRHENSSSDNKKFGMTNIKDMYKMYKSLDKNGDGKITVEDVEILLRELGLGFVSKHLSRAIFDIVDINHNGKLDFRDLIALTTLLQRLFHQKDRS